MHLERTRQAEDPAEQCRRTLRRWFQASPLGRASSALGLTALLLTITGTAVWASVGKTPGSFSVSPTGTANYSIPIWAPPGPRGMQPHIAVVYTEQGGGPLGVGWALGGLSSITRCNKTIAQDGAAAPVTLTYSDAFCLDGRRLRLTSSDTLSTYGQDGTTYETELDTFSKVTAHSAQGNGPAYFTVQTKDGLTYEYGNGTASNNSQVRGTDAATTAVAWMLDQVTDKAGNTMVVSYVAPSATLTGTTIPASISWTPTSHGATSYSYKMVFTYTSNALPSSTSGYVAGTPVLNQQLLQNISVQTGAGTVIKQYNFGYGTPSPTTGSYRLSTVQECADSAASNCLYPTAISYQDGSKGVAGSATPAISNNDGTTPYHYDVNGDGFQDLIYRSGTTWYVAFGSASGTFGAPISTGVPYGPTMLPGDLLGNGTVGLLWNNSNTWYFTQWNGSSFASASTLLNYDTTIPHYVLADIDGDGRQDLVGAYLAATSPKTLQLVSQLNTSSAASVSFAGPVSAGSIAAIFTIDFSLLSNTDYGGSSLSNLHGLDFDGDGRQDVALEVTNQNPDTGALTAKTFELTSNGSTFTTHQVSQQTGNNFGFVSFLNFNSDACTDFLINGIIYIAGCNGSAPGAISVGSLTVLAAMDWDGDGRTDLLVKNGSTVGVYLSNGVGLSSLIPTSFSATAVSYFVVDANGDGLDDLGYFNTSRGIGFYPHNGGGTPPDLVNSITDGYGINFSSTYIAITQGNYSNSANATTYPLQNVHAPMYVVKSVTASDGIDGTYTQTFTYVGARRDLKRRSFEGFESQRVTDSRASSLVTNTTFAQGFPYTGASTQVDTFQHDGTTIVSHATNTFQTTTLDSVSGNQRYFPHLQSSSVQQREVGGALNGALITTTGRSYSYDPYGNATIVATTVTDNDTTSPYSGSQWTTTTTTSITPDASTNWCLNLPTQVTVTNTAPGVPSITRTTSFSNPDYVNCRETTVTTEPGSAYAVARALSYDAFGNVNSVGVTGVGMATRTSTTTWGTTGQFPVNIRDALSNSLGASGYQVVKSYDYNLGVQTSEVLQSADGNTANAPPTSWQYDAFGRKTKETRPDGTSTGWVYNDCVSTWGWCPIGGHALALAQTLYNTDQSTQTDGTTFFDTVDRPVIAIQRSFSGNYDRRDLSYDNLGRVLKQSMPCAYSALMTSCPFQNVSAYDALGRVTQTQRPISATNSTLQTTMVGYEGRTTITTDPQGKATTQVTTVAGTLGVSQDHTGYHQNFTYDAFGSLLSVTDSLSTTLFTADYDYGNRAMQRDATDVDLDVSTATGQHRHFNYDALGELTSWSDAKGQTFSETYDALSRPLMRIEKLASGTADLTTSWTWGASAASHNIGQLSGVSASGYAETYSYDTAARLSQRFVTIPSDSTYEYDWTYGVTGQPATLTYPSSTSSYRLKLAYAYFQNGFLSQVSDANSSTVFWQANLMNPRGQVTVETLGNGVVTGRTFDDVTGWVSSITSGVSGNVALQNESYLFDEVGNLTQRQNNNVGLTENFYYDDAYRLDHSALNGTVNLQMAYSAAGNITSRSDLAGGATWTYDATHRHAVTQAGSSGNTYTYDANGNASSRNGQGITWTSYNHPLVINTSGSGESVQFAYTHNHTRWSAVYSGSSGVETTYFVGDLLEKVSGVGGSFDFRHYIYAGGTKVAVYSRTTGGVNTLRYIREDHQESVASILNSDGTTYVKESFAAFGARRSACTWSGPPTNGALAKMSAVTRHGYTWQSALGGMGLNDMNGRIQDAVTGRFLSPDPFVQNRFNTQNFNRYSYVNNNPLTYMDPSGFALESSELAETLPISPDLVTVNGNRGGQQEASAIPLSSAPKGGSSASSGGTGGGGGDGSDLPEVTVQHDRAKKPPGFLTVVTNLVQQVTKWVCKAPALSITGTAQLDIGMGGVGDEAQLSFTYTSRGQIIISFQMGVLGGIQTGAAVTAGVQPGLQLNDAPPGVSDTSTYVANAFAVDQFGGGGSVGWSEDSASGGWESENGRVGEGASAGWGFFISGGKIHGKQFATRSFCQ